MGRKVYLALYGATHPDGLLMGSRWFILERDWKWTRSVFGVDGGSRHLYLIELNGLSVSFA